MSEINTVSDHRKIDEHMETIAFFCAQISLWKGVDCVTYLCCGVPCNRSQVTTCTALQLVLRSGESRAVCDGLRPTGLLFGAMLPYELVALKVSSVEKAASDFARR